MVLSITKTEEMVTARNRSGQSNNKCYTLFYFQFNNLNSF